MWLSDRRRPEREGEEPVQMGVVTLSGDPAGVWTGSERRNAVVFGPAGYIWQPELGQEVLVLKTGEGYCVAGARSGDPGEIVVRSSGGASVALHRDGSIDLTGTVLRFNGTVLAEKPEEEEE